MKQIQKVDVSGEQYIASGMQWSVIAWQMRSLEILIVQNMVLDRHSNQ